MMREPLLGPLAILGAEVETPSQPDTADQQDTPDRVLGYE